MVHRYSGVATPRGIRHLMDINAHRAALQGGSLAIGVALAGVRSHSPHRNMSDLSKNSGCLGILLNLMGLGPKRSAAGAVANRSASPGAPPPALPVSVQKEITYPYGLRDEFLSPAEISFFHVLKGVMQTGHYLITKVRLSDLFYVKQPNVNQAARNRTDGKHVDFVICDAGSMQPLLAIELDDASHKRKDSQESDDFKNRAFAAAGLPLLRVKAARTYAPQEVDNLIRGMLRMPVAEP